MYAESLEMSEADLENDVDRHLLMVTFDSIDSKLLLNDLVLVDPLNDFIGYKVQKEGDFEHRDYFYFNGQIVFVEGMIRDRTIYVRKINTIVPSPRMSINENYIRDTFYKEVNNFI